MALVGSEDNWMREYQSGDYIKYFGSPCKVISVNMAFGFSEDSYIDAFDLVQECNKRIYVTAMFGGNINKISKKKAKGLFKQIVEEEEK